MVVTYNLLMSMINIHLNTVQSYRMNRENAVFFKSKAAARAAGYRESKR